MKQILITIIFAIVLITSTKAQTFQELLNDYNNYCNELVKDTIIQYGEVLGSYIPVVDDNGDICKYIFRGYDTTWAEPKCKEYKINDYSWGNLTTATSIDDGLIKFNQPILSSWITPQENIIKQVNRKHVCLIKREKPTGEDFFRWVIKYFSDGRKK